MAEPIGKELSAHALPQGTRATLSLKVKNAALAVGAEERNVATAPAGLTVTGPTNINLTDTRDVLIVEKGDIRIFQFKDDSAGFYGDTRAYKGNATEGEAKIVKGIFDQYKCATYGICP